MVTIVKKLTLPALSETEAVHVIFSGFSGLIPYTTKTGPSYQTWYCSSEVEVDDTRVHLERTRGAIWARLSCWETERTSIQVMQISWPPEAPHTYLAFCVCARARGGSQVASVHEHLCTYVRHCLGRDPSHIYVGACPVVPVTDCQSFAVRIDRVLALLGSRASFNSWMYNTPIGPRMGTRSLGIYALLTYSLYPELNWIDCRWRECYRGYVVLSPSKILV